PRQTHNLALVGFMGTGKTSVGHLLAESLRFELVDTDHLIEKQTGKPIRDIFAQDGEPAFRELEKQLLTELAPRQRLVISCGGGLAANADNLASLKTHALVVCLWASPEKIWHRVRHQHHRPLLDDPDPQEKIRALLAAREPFYRQADVMVNTDLRSIKAVAQQIAHQFQLAQAGR
ncbi:MAG: shikimate kinase, partial [Verrucomicrobia bacterium]|nr:shikimate kinase [Verrucomicrobiota bacterium]